MLVLGRRRNEEIIITNKDTGDIIRVMVLDITGNKVVKVGLDDPSRKYIFMRKEIQDRIDKEKANTKLPDPLNEPEPDRAIHFTNEHIPT